jgi:hypothetical protein
MNFFTKLTMSSRSLFLLFETDGMKHGAVSVSFNGFEVLVDYVTHSVAYEI